MQDTRSTADGTARGGAKATSELLDHGHRRELLRLLADPEAPRRVGALARELNAQCGCWAGSPEVRDTATTLHHVHLPKLTSVGAIRYDASQRRVVSVDRERVAELLELAGEEVSTVRA
jgi:hypothetical protein